MPVTEAQVVEALRPVEDPELRQSIVELDMVRGVRVDGPKVDLTIALTVAGCPLLDSVGDEWSDRQFSQRYRRNEWFCWERGRVTWDGRRTS